MPPDVVLECVGEDRVQVEQGAALESSTLSSSGSTHQHIGEENKKAISLLSSPLLFHKDNKRSGNQNKNQKRSCYVHGKCSEPQQK